jgi:predicted alpha/beta-fold hydrolase
MKMVVSISAPIDLVRCSAFAERPSATVYRWFIVAKLRGRYGRVCASMPPEFTPERMRGVRTIRHFDEAVIAPLHGFRDADEYYRQASASLVLPHARVPTAIVHACDDPLVPVAPVLDARAVASRYVRFILTERGGHVGFLGARAAPGDDDRFWAECRAADLIALAMERA